MEVNICNTYQCGYEIHIETENRPLTNNREMVQFARIAAEQVFSDSNSVIDEKTLASEDFSEFSSRVPGVFLFPGSWYQRAKYEYSSS